MKENNLSILLHIIKSNGNINKLIREGVSFKEVTSLTNDAIEQEYLTYENEKIFVTDKGVEFLSKTSEITKKLNKEEWIEKDFKSQVEQIDKNFIFLPRQNELTFRILS
jgi:predicted transcriptional regulator